MKIKTFSGDFSDIGKQQGKIYFENGVSFDKIKINARLYKKQLAVYQEHYPAMLQELKSMADAVNFDRDKLIYSFLCNDLLWYIEKLGLRKACTIFGVKCKNGVFVGRNYDWLPVTEKYFEVYKVKNPQRNTFIAVTDMSIDNENNLKDRFYSANDAINDKGLFIGITFAHNDKWSYGLSSSHIVKLIAETCSTTDDALKVFKKVPLCCPKNFFIADKRGKMAVVEHTSKKFKVLYPNNDVLIQTNHYVDPELVDEDTVLKETPYHNTYIRYYETLQKINFKKDKFNQNDIVNVLGLPGSYTCQNSKEMKTIWTLALDMKSKKYKLYWDLLGKRKEKFLKFD